MQSEESLNAICETMAGTVSFAERSWGNILLRKVHLFEEELKVTAALQ
jgi:hypothetical protein